MGQVYIIKGHLEATRDGYWIAGTFTDKEQADRVCAWLNSVSKLSKELWMNSEDGDLAPEIENMEENVENDGWYEVEAEQVFETPAQWMEAHSKLDEHGMSAWPDVHAIQLGLDTHDAHCDEAKEAKQLRLL
jgi:hypothetical protein